MESIRWGIVATGGIAGSMAEALSFVPDAELVAVGSRSMDSAETFAARWGIAHPYGNYVEVFNDPDVDVVYIATPHSAHHENVIAALEAGKHVLCEKPLTLNASQAAECSKLARREGLFLMEAVWMRFFPLIVRLREMVAGGVIGDVQLLEASFCINMPFDPDHRLYNPLLGGGALLDLGIYPLSLATLLLGAPESVDGQARIGSTGVDEMNAILLTFGDGSIAQLASSMRGDQPHSARVMGTRGRIEVPAFFHPDELTLYVRGRPAERVELPARGNGYVHEVEEVHRCLRKGLTESPAMPLDETVAMLELMDSLRSRWGVEYPADRQK